MRRPGRRTGSFLLGSEGQTLAVAEIVSLGFYSELQGKSSDFTSPRDCLAVVTKVQRKNVRHPQHILCLSEIIYVQVYSFDPKNIK